MLRFQGIKLIFNYKMLNLFRKQVNYGNTRTVSKRTKME